MNDPEPFDGPDPRLSERMERAVGGLRAPDVVPRALARGRRQRTHRRLVHGASGLAAATVLVLAVPAVGGDWPGRTQDPSGPSVAVPAATSRPSTSLTTAASGTGGSEDNPCGAATGWWSKSTAQIKADLSALLPAGTRIGGTKESVAGEWRGRLVTGDDVGSVDLTLLPPPGILGPRRSLEEARRLGRCGGGANEPWQPVKPCDDITGHVDDDAEESANVVACEEIRSEGTIVGVVTQQATSTVVNGQDQPTDQTYLVATLAGPEGGHVELVVDEPTLTTHQARDILTDPVWTS